MKKTIIIRKGANRAQDQVQVVQPEKPVDMKTMARQLREDRKLHKSKGMRITPKFPGIK